jgi:hypothetical protein
MPLPSLQTPCESAPDHSQVASSPINDNFQAATAAYSKKLLCHREFSCRSMPHAEIFLSPCPVVLGYDYFISNIIVVLR